MPCTCSCPRRRPHLYSEWCDACRAEYDEWADREAETYRLGIEHMAHDATPPATREEWLAYLDEVAPLVMEPMGAPT